MSSRAKIRIATRKSPLALAQTRSVAAMLRSLVPDVTIEEIHIVTEGDRVRDRPVSSLGGKGVYVAELEACIAEGRADFAVHSLKDVPRDAHLTKGLGIVAVPPREDPHDALIAPLGIGLFELRAGARVGTTSFRRICQLKAQRGDLSFPSLRGNVDTRLARLDEGRYDAIVLAVAGLRRLGLGERPHWVIPSEICLPAPGQGTLAIEARVDDARMRELLTKLNHKPTLIEATAERTMVNRLEGGCRVPLAGYARLIDGSRLSLDGMVGSVHGTKILFAAAERYLSGREMEAGLDAAKELGLEVAESLLAQGALALIREAEVVALSRAHSGNGGGGGNRWI